MIRKKTGKVLEQKFRSVIGKVAQTSATMEKKQEQIVIWESGMTSSDPLSPYCSNASLLYIAFLFFTLMYSGNDII